MGINLRSRFVAMAVPWNVERFLPMARLALAYEAIRLEMYHVDLSQHPAYLMRPKGYRLGSYWSIRETRLSIVVPYSLTSD